MRGGYRGVQIFLVFLLEHIRVAKHAKLLQKLFQSRLCCSALTPLRFASLFFPHSHFKSSPSHILLFPACTRKQKVPELGQSGLNRYHCEFYCTRAIHSVSNQARLYPHPLPAPQPNQTHICRRSARNYT